MANDAFAVSVAPTTGLDSTGDTVSVTLKSLPADSGLFVRLCVQPQPGTRPAAATCDGQGVWVVENYPFGPPPTNGSVVKPSAGPVTLPVRAVFGAIDCTTTTCGVFTRRDHPSGATDFTLDTFTPLSFAGEEAPSTPEVTPEPETFNVTITPTADVTAGDAVQASVTGVPSDQGIYVRWCTAPAQGQTRPSADQCDGQGVWALEAYPYGPRPTDGSVVDPTAGPISLRTTASIAGVDCTKATCGVATRRDHRGGADTSMDTFTPVTLATVGDGDGEREGEGNGEGPGNAPENGGDSSTDTGDNTNSDNASETADSADRSTTAESATGTTASSASALPSTGATTAALLPFGLAIAAAGLALTAAAGATAGLTRRWER
jgi:hypothetical protein